MGTLAFEGRPFRAMAILASMNETAAAKEGVCGERLTVPPITRA